MVDEVHWAGMVKTNKTKCKCLLMSTIGFAKKKCNNWVADLPCKCGFERIRRRVLMNTLRIISLNDMKLANVYNKGHQFIIIKYDLLQPSL
jgi:hypothetical protein